MDLKTFLLPHNHLIMPRALLQPKYKIELFYWYFFHENPIGPVGYNLTHCIELRPTTKFLHDYLLMTLFILGRRTQ